MNRLALLLRTAIAPLLWGSTYLVTTEFLPAAPMWNALLRALPAGLILLALRPALPSGSWWWRALVLGALNIGGFFALLFVAAQRLPGGVAATLGSVQTVLVIGLAALLLSERPRPVQLGAALAGIVGVALLVLRGSAALDLVGVLAGLGSAVSMALGLVLTRRWGLPPGVTGLTSTAWQLLGGAVVLLPLALVFDGAPPALDGRALLGFAYLSVLGTAMAYVVFFAGLRRLPASAISMLGLISPLTATLLGWIVLSQALTAVQLIGAALVLASVVIGQLGGGRPTKRPPTAQPAGAGVREPGHGPIGTAATSTVSVVSR